MSRGRIFKTVTVLAIFLAVATTAALAATRNFSTHLAGRFELPIPVDTQAQGQAIFQLSKDGTELHYKLIVANIENVTAAHIHLIDKPDGTGGVVVWLYPSAPPAQPIPGRSDGVLAEGTITEDDLVGALEDDTLDDLLAAIESGTTYVNVHTTQHGAGEIRGNLP